MSFDCKVVTVAGSPLGDITAKIENLSDSELVAKIVKTTQTAANLGLCGNASCGNKKPQYRCTRCQVIRYCSTSCQTQDWEMHKLACKVLKKK